MTNFHIGQKVVCVNDKNWRNPKTVQPVPKKGRVYTIAHLGLFLDGEKGVELSELGKCGSDAYQPDWLVDRFRPVIERKADIAVFRKLLVPGQRERETAP